MVRVELIRERGLAYPAGAPVGCAADLAAVARAAIGNQDREVFLTLHLSTKHRVNSVEVTAIGTLNTTLVHPRETFRGAILACSSSVAFAHLHPSGDATPSPEDLALTAQLMQAGELLGIRVLDHVVIGDPGFTSLRETTGLWAGSDFHR
jgi:DNA repair protein RadC